MRRRTWTPIAGARTSGTGTPVIEEGFAVRMRAQRWLLRLLRRGGCVGVVGGGVVDLVW